MKFVFMITDECGDDSRAYGSSFLESVHEFPAFDADDEAMQAAFDAWKLSLVTKAQEEWNHIYGPESRIFLERLYSDMSMGDWRRLGYGGD